MGYPDLLEVLTTDDEIEAALGKPNSRVRAKVLDTLDDICLAFARTPFVVVASYDSAGRVDVSPKGDLPGFVYTLDRRTIAIPERLGNRRADTFRNVLQNPRVGLIFIVPGRGETLRVSGSARIVRDSWLRERMAVADRVPELALVVTVEEAFALHEVHGTLSHVATGHVEFYRTRLVRRGHGRPRPPRHVGGRSGRTRRNGGAAALLTIIRAVRRGRWVARSQLKGQARGRASFLHWRKDGSSPVLQQHHDESGRLRVAGVAPHDVNIRRSLVERLPCFERNGRLAFQLHNDLAFEHVDERMGIMSMDHVLSARRIRHLNYATLLARIVREIDREQVLHICRSGRDGHKHQERRQVTAEFQVRFLHTSCLSANSRKRG
jgi:PPOX class probable FMN-dependent enzyme